MLFKAHLLGDCTMLAFGDTKKTKMTLRTALSKRVREHV